MSRRYERRGISYLIAAAGDVLGLLAKRLRSERKEARRARREGKPETTLPATPTALAPLASAEESVKSLEDMLKEFPIPNENVVMARPAVAIKPGTRHDTTPSIGAAAPPLDWEAWKAKSQKEGLVAAGPPPPMPPPLSHQEAADRARAEMLAAEVDKQKADATQLDAELAKLDAEAKEAFAPIPVVEEKIDAIRMDKIPIEPISPLLTIGEDYR